MLRPMSHTLLPDPLETVQGLGLDMAPMAGALLVVDAELMGLAFLDQSLTGEPMREDDLLLWRTQLANVLVVLDNARSFETISELNIDLQRRNTELEQTIADLTEARRTITLLEGVQQVFRSTLRRDASVWDYLLVLGVSTVVALLFNATSPNGIPLLPEGALGEPPPTISQARAGELQGEAVFVDARPEADFERGRLPGAVNMPPGFFDMTYPMRLGKADLDQPVVVYGRTLSRLYDRETAQRILKRDHEQVFLLEGGLDAWREAGLPVETKAKVTEAAP